MFFSGLLIGGVVYWQLLRQTPLFGTESWSNIALSSFLPFTNALFFSTGQSILVLVVVLNFWRRELRSEFVQVVYTYPFENSLYMRSKIMGFLWVFISLAAISILTTMLIHLFISNSPFYLLHYIWYYLTLTLPSLCFSLGAAMLLTRCFRNPIPGGMLYLLIMGFVYFFLSEFQHGAGDIWSRKIPNTFSEIAGHPNLYPYLLQRLSFLLMGCGMLFCSITTLRRLPNRSSTAVVLYGVGLIGLGFIASQSFHLHYKHNDQIRAEYHQTFQKYASEKHIRIPRHNLFVQLQENMLIVQSKLEVFNPHTEHLDHFLLYLNPHLTITSIRTHEQEVPFSIENQILFIHLPLQPGEHRNISLSYWGGIDERVAYPEIADSIYYRLEKYTPQPGKPSPIPTLFKQGRRFAFLSSEYTLLTPESLWYPAALPPVNVVQPYLTLHDFTEYTLHVEQYGNQTLISQGKMEEKGETIIFRPPTPLPGISLCAGEYTSKSVFLDSISLELYHFKENVFYTEGFQSSEKEILSIIQFCKNEWESSLSTPFPYKRFRLVESPVSFHSFFRPWKNGSEYTQPEMFFFPEKAVGIRFSRPTDSHKEEDYSKSERNHIISFLRGLFHPLENSSNYFYSYARGEIESAEYPAVNRVINSLTGVTFRTHSKHHYAISPEPEISYLSIHSLREAIQDRTLSIDLFNDILQIKTYQLYSFLLTKTTASELSDFISAFRQRNTFSSSPLELFLQDFKHRFQFDLSDYLSDWYDQQGVPQIFVKDFQSQRLDPDGEHYLVRFRVANNSDVNGSICLVTQEKEFPGSRVTRHYKHFEVQARTYKEIGVICGSLSELWIDAIFTLSIPRFFQISGEICNSWNLTEGVQEIDSSVFVGKNNGEIIIDNRSCGFQLVSPPSPRALNRPALKDIKKNWTEIATAGSYGHPIRSVCYKLAGTGAHKAIWEAVIDTPGEYEVSFFHQRLVGENNSSTVFPGSILHYTVIQENTKKEVVIFPDEVPSGWVSLGRFELTDGKIQVILDDLGGEVKQNEMEQQAGFPARKQLIAADAVRWRKTATH